MAKKDLSTLTEGEEQRDQFWAKFWRIRGLADILRHAASENESLPGSSVEEVSGQIYDLINEAKDALEQQHERGKKIT